MNIEVNDFNGPLDLLLHLITTSKMDVYDIDIKVITKEIPYPILFKINYLFPELYISMQ